MELSLPSRWDSQAVNSVIDEVGGSGCASVRRFARVQGVELSYLEWGEAEKTGCSLLIVHGLIAEAETFRSLVDALPAMRVVAVDLPGNGFSYSTGRAGTSFAATAAVLREFASQIGMEGAVWLGHSYGGALTLQAAVDAPHAMRAMILMAPAHPYAGHAAVVRFFQSPVGRVLARCLPKMPDWVYYRMSKLAPGKRREISRERLNVYLHALRVPGVIDETLRVVATWQASMESLRASLESEGTALPVLVIWGSCDPVVPVHSAGQLMAHLPQARLVVLDGVAHLPNDEDPTCTGQVIGEFLCALQPGVKN